MVLRSTLEAMARQLEGAACPEAVFGNLAGRVPARLAVLKSVRRDLTRACHPDLAAPADKPLATQVFQALEGWENIAHLKIEAGTYGDYQPYRAPTSAYQPVELWVRGRKLKLSGLIAQGTFAGVHRATYEDEAKERAVFVKLARHACDNDLLEREFRVLKGFQKPGADPDAESFLATQRAYVPSPIASFSLLDETGAKHRANVLSVPQGSCFSGEMLREAKFPDGMEPKHVWWIFRRLLLTLWMAHLKGYVHGAVTPDHVLIFPEAHGIVLLDWTCAAKIGQEHVPALHPSYEGFYPPEVLRKETATPATDLFMAAATAIHLLGGDPAMGRTPDSVPDSVPDALRDALLSCLASRPSRRPQDAEAFHNTFGALLGRRVYTPLRVP